ncbi:phosphocholine cytidylyltransferase family protein [Dongia rigui]|uniref:Phosphocholine cytidylyltransferase family protein n=1 Tax=Dongia rigui TaxID=940149 RepID=A0ABU5DUA9_9PROT|nr:phosphocholine cytidylyltransferase family protein [Dongia rigui]MDY0870303.1 phosphocholine cytidylyltransferase family protein [Dongia rigui]
MKAVILSAGQGSRLLPLTEGRPKCLLQLGDKTLIEWQIWALTQGGVDDIAVVVGYHAQDVVALLKKLESPKLKIRTIYNPFYKLADNLASCWMARHEMKDDFVILNGDTVIEPKIFQKLMASPSAPITVTIDKKESYDSDDMKVHLKGTRLLEIGKTLAPERTNGESIGMLLFRGDGPKLFTDTLENLMYTPEGVKWWYLRAIGQIAEHHQVETCSIEGSLWGEVDFPADHARVSQLVTEF